MQRKLPSDSNEFLLRPSPQELRDTHVLFHAQHAVDSSPERRKRYGYPVIEHATILEALRYLGFKVTPESDPEALLGPLDYDFIFSKHMQQSTYEGHELLSAAIAAFRGIPCIGPPAPIRGVTEDKVLGKFIAAAAGLEVVEHHLIDPLRPGMADFSLPGRWIVKPRDGCLSMHVMLVDGEAGWRDALVELANPVHGGRQFMAEPFVPGLNLTVPVIEGFPTQGFAVFQEKGRPGDNVLEPGGKVGHTSHYLSEPYDGPGAAETSAAAARMAAAITPFDYGRFDFRFDPETNRLVFLEANIVSAMGPATVVARAAEIEGIDYPSLVGHLVTHSLRRQRRAPAH